MIRSIFLLLPLLLWGSDLFLEVDAISNQSPIYLSAITIARSNVKQHYIDELDKIIAFDLSCTGKGVLSSELTPKALQVRPRIEGKSLFFACMQGENRKTYKVHLTEKLSKDRVHIHQLIAKLQNDLLGVPGIQDKKIIFSVRHRDHEGNIQSEIWMSDYDGENPKQLTFHKNYAISPKFLPRFPFEHYYFVSFKEGQSKVFVGSLHDQKSWKVLPLAGNQLLPSISPTLGKMAFVSDVAGSPDLFLQYFDRQGRPTGRAKQLFSVPRATQATSSFSPDGSKLAFVSDKDGPPRIYVMNIPRREDRKRPVAHLISKKNRHNSSPNWSPDGKKLVYGAKVNGIWQLWIYDFEKKEERQITNSSHSLENPVWASNNLHIICNSEDNGECELYLVNCNNPTPIRISKGMGEKRFPAWEP